MKNYSYSGQSLSFVASELVTSGQPYMIGSAFGVVANSLQPGQSGELFVTGVWFLPKDASEIKLGDKLYWDNVDKVITGKSAPDGSGTQPYKLVGMAAGDAPSGQATVLCRLNGVSTQ